MKFMPEESLRHQEITSNMPELSIGKFNCIYQIITPIIVVGARIFVKSGWKLLRVFHFDMSLNARKPVFGAL